MTAVSALELRDVSSGYAGRPILHGVSLDVGIGEVVAIVGLNGSGKSVLARTVSGVVPVSAGSVLLRGVDITKASPRRRVRAGLHHLSQRRGLVPDLTVAENLRLTAFASGRGRGSAFPSGGHDFPVIEPWSDRLAGTLSGGEQAIVALARAAMARPAVLVADEPTAGLSPAATVRHQEVVARLRAEGTAVLLIEQNADFALRTADRVIALRAGAVALEAPARDVTEADLLEALVR